MGPLLKHITKTVLYTYGCYICTTIHGNCMYVYKTIYCDVLSMVTFHKLHDKCFARSGPLLQIRSHIINLFISSLFYDQPIQAYHKFRVVLGVT